MILVNPTDIDVRDYPIQDPANPTEVGLWSIRGGERLNFPDYVAQVLLDRYGFLQREVTKEQLAAEKAAEEKLRQGQQFSQVRIVEAQPDTAGAGYVPVATDQPGGYTNELVSNNASAYVPTQE